MTFDNIKLDKSFYSTDMNGFTNTLEELDPSTEYKGTALEGLDAFERQLKRFDIKVKGYNCDTVEKFFSNSQTAVLFPEFVKRCVKSGINETDVLKDITATSTKIIGTDYRPITCVNEGDDGKANTVAEGAAIPVTKVKTQGKLITLNKRGRILAATYESLRFKRLDLISVMLKQIGKNIVTAQLGDAINVIISGDGNSNPAKEISVASKPNLTYNDLIKLWSQFSDYQMNCLLAAPDVMQKLLAIEELKNPMTGLNFQATGKLTTPLGATLYQSASVPAGKLVAIDKTCAIEEVVCDEINVDYDKLIDKQLEEAAITSTKGFAKLFKDAAVVMAV